MHLTYTTTTNVTAQPMIGSVSVGQPGIITEIVITGTDASCDVTILDGLSNIFAKTSIDTTTANGLIYLYGSSDILRKQTTGVPKVTIANNTGSVTVNMLIAPLNS